MDDQLTARVTYLDGANIERAEGKVSFIEDGKRREVVVEATDGSALFIPAELLVAYSVDPAVQ